MSEKKTGGPAFPSISHAKTSRDGEHWYNIRTEGMTLRDFFATKATDGDIADMMERIPKIEKVYTDGTGSSSLYRGLPENARQIARYMHADAMLKAREA